VATVLVTSEDHSMPWTTPSIATGVRGLHAKVAGEAGDRTPIPVFDAPQAIRHAAVEVEEPGVARTQKARLDISQDTAGGPTGECCGRSTTSARRAVPSSGGTGH
jgi:hypothetical protein